MGRENGFALMETVVLGAILAVASLLGVSFVLLNIARARSEAETTAIFLAQEQLAMVEAKPAAYLQSAASLSWQGSGESPVVRNRTQYEVETNVAAYEGSGYLRDIQVIVRWTERGKERERRLHKLVDVYE